MSAENARRHFRFAFSLRTLFVAITLLFVVGVVLCDWLGRQVKIVRERQAILAEIERIVPASMHQAHHGLETWEAKPQTRAEIAAVDVEYIRVSRIRRLLGDESCAALVIPTPASLDPGLVARAENAFPEAQIIAALPGVDARRDSLYAPTDKRKKNKGTVFKTGLK